MHSDDHSDVRNALDHAHPLGVWRAGAAPRVAVGHRIPCKIKSRANDEQCRASMKQHATCSDDPKKKSREDAGTLHHGQNVYRYISRAKRELERLPVRQSGEPKPWPVRHGL